MSKLFTASRVTVSATLKTGSAVAKGASTCVSATKGAGSAIAAGYRAALAAHKASKAPRGLTHSSK